MTSAQLLQMVKDIIRRPDEDELSGDSELYRRLTDAQLHWYDKFSSIIPRALYGQWTLLTTTDSGLTYKFRVSATDQVPMGHVEVIEYPGGPYIFPGTEGHNSSDRFIPGIDHISWPGQRRRTFGNGPWARWVLAPGTIDAGTQPTLQPPSARRLLGWRAAILWAAGTYDTSAWEAREEEVWQGVVRSVRTQFYGEGLEGVPDAGSEWWNFSDRPENYTRQS